MVPVLIARDRNRNTGDAILANITAATIRASLLPMLGAETLLCSDAAGSYGAIARAVGIRHEAVNLKAGERVREGVFHIQNVNAYYPGRHRARSKDQPGRQEDPGRGSFSSTHCNGVFDTSPPSQ